MGERQYLHFLRVLSKILYISSYPDYQNTGCILVSDSAFCLADAPRVILSRFRLLKAKVRALFFTFKSEALNPVLPMYFAFTSFLTS